MNQKFHVCLIIADLTLPIFQSTSQDSASLIQNTPGYYAGSEPLKFWWKHPKIKENWKTVTAALVLVLLGAGGLIFEFHSPSIGLLLAYFSVDIDWDNHLLQPQLGIHWGLRLLHRGVHLPGAGGLPSRLPLHGGQGEEGVRLPPLANVQLSISWCFSVAFYTQTTRKRWEWQIIFTPKVI